MQSLNPFSSSSSSVGTYYHNPKITTPKPRIRNCLNISPRIQKANDPNATSTSISRRESVGLGLCLSFLHLVNPQYSSAAEVCDFTAAPSGLEFCDKVVGTGPEPIKGQLIKVIPSSNQHYRSNELKRLIFVYVLAGTLCWKIGEWDGV